MSAPNMRDAALAFINAIPQELVQFVHTLRDKQWSSEGHKFEVDANGFRHCEMRFTHGESKEAMTIKWVSHERG
jgi:hypothetical protein